MDSFLDILIYWVWGSGFGIWILIDLIGSLYIIFEKYMLGFIMRVEFYF